RSYSTPPATTAPYPLSLHDALPICNGGEADLRLQWPKGMFRPFAFGGIGWTHYSIARSSTTGTAVLHGDDVGTVPFGAGIAGPRDRKSTRLNSSHSQISYAVFCLKK